MSTSYAKPTRRTACGTREPSARRSAPGHPQFEAERLILGWHASHTILPMGRSHLVRDGDISLVDSAENRSHVGVGAKWSPFGPRRNRVTRPRSREQLMGNEDNLKRAGETQTRNSQTAEPKHPIKLPNGRTVDARIGGFQYRAVHRQLCFDDGGTLWIFDMVITSCAWESPERWSVIMEVASHDEGTCRDGVGIYVPLETFKTNWRDVGRPVTDPDDVAVAVVEEYSRRRPHGPCEPLDDRALGAVIGHAWTAGLLYAIGYAGKLVEHGDLDSLARGVLDSIPGPWIDQRKPSAKFFAGLKHALEDAHGSGLIQTSAADDAQ